MSILSINNEEEMSIKHYKTPDLGQSNLSLFFFVYIRITSTPCYLYLSLQSLSVSSIHHMAPSANQFHPCLLTKAKRLESLKVMNWERFLVSAGKWQSDCLWYEGVLSLALWRLLLNSQTPALYKEKKEEKKNPSELNSFAQALTQWSHPRNVGKIKVGCVVLNFRLTLRWDPSVFTSGARITVNRSVRSRDLKTSARIPLRLFYSSVNSSFKAHWLIWPQISSNRVEQKDPVREIYNYDICFQRHKWAELRRAQNFSINMI